MSMLMFKVIFLPFLEYVKSDVQQLEASVREMKITKQFDFRTPDCDLTGFEKVP